MLKGPDINSFKSDINLGAISADFMIDKATGGTGYVNPNCDAQVQRAIQLGLKWGVYHYYSDGFGGDDPIAEADWFVNNVLGYIGHGLLILDWERGGNPHVTDVSKALAWLNHVLSRTGIRPLIYMSSSLVNELDWSPVIAQNYGLWAAAWPDGNTAIPNYQMDPNRDPNPHWDGNVNDVLWQFTSTGRLDGYGGNLDCNFFYGTKEAWDAYAGTVVAPPTPVPQPPTPPDPTPTPEPDPTTTTVEPDPTPDPAPDETTTTTQEPQPEPPTSTTTTTVSESKPIQGPKFWVAIVTLFLALLDKIRGGQRK